MIAMSGCAKRNADRELARVLDLIKKHRAVAVNAIYAAGGVDVPREEGAVNALSALALALEHREHRTR